MNKVQLLKNETVGRIFGKVEIATIIKKLSGVKLKQTEKNYLYRSIRPKLIAASMLAEADILKDINRNNRNNTSIIDYNLDLYGYQMFWLKKRKSKKIGVEELIVTILIKYPYARYIEAIPILIIKNKIDKFKILELASKYGIKNKIGYMIETSMLIKNIRYLKDILLYLEENKDEEESFLVDGEYYFLSETSPQRVKKWNLLGRFFDADFIKNARAYL